MRADCWPREEQANFTTGDKSDNAFIENEEKLFMAHNTPTEDNQKHIWFVDNGCSNLMTGSKYCFSKLEEIDIQKVQLRNGSTLLVKEKRL